MQVNDGTVSGWHNQVGGAKALAAHGTRIGLLGGYGPERDRSVVGELAGEAVQVVGEYRLMLPAGTPLPAEVTAVGRGPVLHVIAADRWYHVALDELTPR